MVRRPAPLLLGENDEAELARWTRSSSVSTGLAARARIVLLAADGAANVQIAELVGWPPRSGAGPPGEAGPAGPDQPTPQDRGRDTGCATGRPSAATPTLTPPPKSLGVTHWSSRLLAARLKVSQVTVAQA